ncbi:hypothetical protein KGF56_004683 [Candida oxycetoniae]|uniref:Uncharacterized protein n=1 Tax=Candida oxycetoniae TaxID=497107 RepID=A0AAI9STK7_9ASCO|nr:uncharacterized protein KGF56_004683 [Candida oxycetoniae]KAI3402591.2 hypothetical protein KGF56_004683 [Candida oxycetoniae]
MSVQALNAQYLYYLLKYPLLTKSITSGILNGLNEIVSSVLTNEYQETSIFGMKVKHIFSSKLLKMIIYGSLISTPISHNMYSVINKNFKAPLTPKQKVLQLLTSLLTVTPTLSVCFVSWISLINNYAPTKGTNICGELKRIVYTIKMGLKKGLPPVLRSSLVTSFLALIAAQKFVHPDLWVVFFSLIYFVLGTFQNTKLKRLQKQQKLKELDKKDI